MRTSEAGTDAASRGLGHLPLGLGSVAGRGCARARRRVRARASRQHHGQLRAPRRRWGRASGHPRALPGPARLGRAGTGGCWLPAEKCEGIQLPLRRRHPESLSLLALFLFPALSLCPPSCSHNAVGFAFLKPCGPQSGGVGGRRPNILGDYRCGCPAPLHPGGPGPSDSSSFQKTMSQAACLAQDARAWKKGQDSAEEAKWGYSRIFLLSPSWT